MKMWSRGLGRTELKMDFGKYVAIADPESKGIQILGQIKDPVNWEFKITMQPEDVAGMLKIFFTWPTLKMVILHVFKLLDFVKHRKEFGEKGVNLEEKVNAAYDQMMCKSKPKLSQSVTG